MSGAESKILGLSAPWARRLLILSLVANFLVVGEIMQIIGEDRRAEAKRILDGRWDNQRRFRAQRMADWNAVAEMIEKQSYEAAALRELLHRQTDRHHEARRVNVDPLVEVITLMTSEERVVFAGKIRLFVERRARRTK